MVVRYNQSGHSFKSVIRQMNRISILGNSGTGKSYLAGKLGEALSLPVISLDDLYWEPESYGQKHAPGAILKDIEAIRERSEWIVEGVYGELVTHFLARTECLIWLDMDWDICHNNLLERGFEKETQLDPARGEAHFQNLVRWASLYWERDDERSYQGHRQIFDRFSGPKHVLRSRYAVNEIVNTPSRLEKTG